MTTLNGRVLEQLENIPFKLYRVNKMFSIDVAFSNVVFRLKHITARDGLKFGTAIQ